MTAIHRIGPRARGWLRHIWDKATTEDDWSSKGEPLPWWDRKSTPPMCAFPRFDLSETSYVLPMLVDQTPAWREVYTRIADELVGRYTTFWAAIDWLTLIGDDPHQDSYPPEWMVYLPAHLRGRYNPPGWTANGVEPWGLQPDPVGADGNLFFRGFFNLLLGTYSYVSGNDKWEQPFRMTGYQNRRFEWTQHRITKFIEDQWSERPQGAHCENTKIWPYCLSAAGLSLQLYDKVFNANTHWVYDQWIDYAKQHFTTRSRRGDITGFAFYYDPIEQFAYCPPPGLSGYGMLAPLLYLYPQAPEFGQQLYEAGIRDLGWDGKSKSFLQAFDDPRWIAMTLMLAREIGDVATERRLTAIVEQQFGEDFFADDEDRFAWKFDPGDVQPRGQLNGLLILSDIGERGAWTNIFSGPRSAQFDLPTVEGVDYPNLGICEAENDSADGSLRVSTYAATAARRGTRTSWKVTQLADSALVKVYRNGELYNDWRVIGEDAIELNSTIDEHSFRIVCSPAIRTRGRSAAAGFSAIRSNASASSVSPYRMAAPPSCSCCQ